ncbi:MAG: radical SAM protein [Bacteroidales bacterium]|nr:radical SAM protein [Bacteroidales bacterium]
MKRITETQYILNPDYNFRNDIKRSVIIANSESQCEYSNQEWLSFIHPVQAMILSFFSSPIAIDNVVENLIDFLNLNKEEVLNLINPFIENKETIFTQYNGATFKFPKRIIVKYESHLKINYTYAPEDFIYKELDFETARLMKSPSAITVMVTNRCVTNCIYCYADRSKEMSCIIPFERIKELIEEAKILKIKDVHVSGGEFFLYERWHDLLEELYKHGYEKIFISTKVPIKEEDIIKLKQFPNLSFQFSFDSLSGDKLQRILGVSRSYLTKMKKTFEKMDEYGISYHVLSILTKINSDKKDLLELHNYLSTLKKIKKWQVRIAFKSLYSSTEFETIKLQENERIETLKYVDELNKLQKITVEIDKSNLERGYFSAEKGSKSFSGASCSANRSHMFILPDGNVTICEQMYWKKRFIIGNILNNSIEEVWNSAESLKWVNLTKNDFRDESACKNCEMLDECCNKYPNKCWADVLKVYGDENWDFPDPRCNKAPKFLYDII